LFDTNSATLRRVHGSEKEQPSQAPERDVTDVPIERLSDNELEAELTVAASAPGRQRWQRFKALLAERRARRRERAK
jgi:hypothetical protein